MEFQKDWKFNKFVELLSTDQQRETIYSLYKNISKENKKLLFLYLGYEPSNNEIRQLLTQDGLLTLDGITTHLVKVSKTFHYTLNFLCSNSDCEHNEKEIKSSKFFFKKCPKCSSDVQFLNKQNLFNTFNALYLNYFDFYLLNDVDKTIYIIRNKFNNKYYTKSSDESFSNWLYIKLLENKCDINKYLLAEHHGKMKNPKTTLLNIIKENSFIKAIDNINFKPVNETIFVDEDKKYFNLYRGNKYLNMIVTNSSNTDYLIKCKNIKELLFNLTGKDEKGVEHLLDILAMIVQEPHIKTQQLIMFYGEEASGKGTFYELILRPIFEGYISKILGKKIKSQFNGFMSKKIILVLEELKADKDEEDTLKELVTEETILINPKGLTERNENNYLTIIGFSNEQNPISVGKRRGVYFRSRTLGGSILKAPIFRKKYEKEIPKELDFFIQELKTRKFDRAKIMMGFSTDAKKQVISQNKTPVERFSDELANYKDITKYVTDKISTNQLFLSIEEKKESYLYKYEGITYIETEFLLFLYNTTQKNIRKSTITLNKFSEFWQYMNINREDKTHWRRLTNPNNERKTQYVNYEIINSVIKKRYEKDD